MIDSDPISGVSRIAFDSVYLESGITLVPLLDGLFSISEVLVQTEKLARVFDLYKNTSTSMQPFKSVIQRPRNHVRSSLIGVFIGVLPGIGDHVHLHKLASDYSAILALNRGG